MKRLNKKSPTEGNLALRTRMWLACEQYRKWSTGVEPQTALGSLHFVHRPECARLPVPHPMGEVEMCLICGYNTPSPSFFPFPDPQNRAFVRYLQGNSPFYFLQRSQQRNHAFPTCKSLHYPFEEEGTARKLGLYGNEIIRK